MLSQLGLQEEGEGRTFSRVNPPNRELSHLLRLIGEFFLFKVF